MRKVPLTQGCIALIDDEDYQRVTQFKWYARKDRWHTYAERQISLRKGKQTAQAMSRFIMGLTYGDPRQVDHRDRVNTLDNRKQNLRVTLNKNPQNRGMQRNCTSGFKGVSWYKATKKWIASIRVNKKRIHLGYFSVADEAAKAYDVAAIKHHGEYAVTNKQLKEAQ